MEFHDSLWETAAIDLYHPHSLPQNSSFGLVETRRRRTRITNQTVGRKVIPISAAKPNPRRMETRPKSLSILCMEYENRSYSGRKLRKISKIQVPVEFRYSISHLERVLISCGIGQRSLRPNLLLQQHILPPSAPLAHPRQRSVQLP